MRKKNGRKKLLSLIVSLCLLINGIGTLPAAVHAEGETQTAVETPKGVTVYVDGVNGADTNDGLTDQAPLKTMKAAYGKIPADNEKSTIVVIGEVKLAENDLDLHGSATTRYVFPVHSGEVIITSKVGEKNYTATGALNFGTDLSYCLQGNTTFEQIKVSSAAKAIHACYYELKFGKGISSLATSGDGESAHKGIIITVNGGTVKNPCYIILPILTSISLSVIM